MSNHATFCAGIAQSVYRLDWLRLDGPLIESQWGEIFHNCLERHWDPPITLYNVYRVSLRGKDVGGWHWQQTFYSLEVKERVELHLFSNSDPSWPVLGRPLPLTLLLLITQRYRRRDKRFTVDSITVIRHLKHCEHVRTEAGNLKSQWSRYRPGVAQKVGRGITLLFLYRGTRRGEWSATRPGRNLPPAQTQYPLYRRLNGPQGRSWRAENLFLTWIPSPDRPGRRESL